MGKLKIPEIINNNFEHSPGLQQFLEGMWEYGEQFYEPAKQWIEKNLPLDYYPFDVFDHIQHTGYWFPEILEQRREENPNYFNNIQELSHFRSCVIHFEGDVKSLNHYLCSFLSELIKNCTKKGASYVQVYYQEGLLIVSDNIEYLPDKLTKKLDCLNKPCVESTRPNRGGYGIQGIREFLSEDQNNTEEEIGRLFYSTDGKRIFAIMTWDETNLLSLQK